MERIFQKIALILLIPISLFLFKLFSKKNIRRNSILKLIGSLSTTLVFVLFFYKNADADVSKGLDISSSKATDSEDNLKKKSPQHWYSIRLGRRPIGEEAPVVSGTKEEVAVKLIDYLQDPADDIRQSALDFLRDYADSSTCPHLLDAYKKSDSNEIKSRIGSIIIWLEDGSCKEEFLKIVKVIEQERLALRKEKEEDVRKISQKKDKSSIPKLIEYLSDKDIDVTRQMQIIRTLGELKAKEALPHLINYLSHKDDILVRWTIWSLGEIADVRAVEHLIPFINHKKSHVKKSVIEALGNIKSVQSLNVLKENLGNPDILIKAYSAISLAKAGESSGAKVLLSMLEDSLEKNQDIERYETLFDFTLRNITNLIEGYFSNFKAASKPTEAQQVILERFTQDRKLLRKVAEVPDNVNVASFLTNLCVQHPDYRVQAYSFFAYYMAKRPVSECEDCRIALFVPQPVLRIEGIDKHLCQELSNYFRIIPEWPTIINKLDNLLSNERIKARQFVNILEKSEIRNKVDLENILKNFAKKLKIKY